MKTQIEIMAVDLFNEKFGTDLQTRFEKLDEEYKELVEAKNESSKGYEHILDELSDTTAVLAHIAHIYGTNIE